VAAPAVVAEAATVPGPPARALFTITGLLHASDVRSGLTTGVLAHARTVALQGVDFLVQPLSGGVGLAGRLTRATTGVGDLASLEGGVLLGAPGFSLEAAYVRRAGYSPTSGLMHDSTYVFGRVGIRMRSTLGNTGFALGGRAGAFIPVGDEGSEDSARGWEGETSVQWVGRRFPLGVHVGYRLERFAVAGMEQQVSALILGSGIILGGRR
jgi:hypothetical protein